MARRRMEAIICKHGIRKALTSKLPFGKNQKFREGDEVLIHNEKERKRGLDPYKTTHVEGRQAFIDRDGTKLSNV